MQVVFQGKNLTAQGKPGAMVPRDQARHQPDVELLLIIGGSRGSLQSAQEPLKDFEPSLVFRCGAPARPVLALVQTTRRPCPLGKFVEQARKIEDEEDGGKAQTDQGQQVTTP